MNQGHVEAGEMAAAESKPSAVAAGKRRATWPSGEVLTRGLLGIALAMTAYLFVNILMYRYGRDQGIYATVADSMLRGGMPYRDAWDFKPPGIYLIYAATRAVLGPGQWAIRVVEVLGLVSVAGAFVVLARRFFSDGRIGILAAALAVL